MKKIIIGAGYTLWGTIVLLLSSVPYIPEKFKYLDVLTLASIVMALAVHLRLRDFKGEFPFRYILIYTYVLLVLANVLGLICLGLLRSGSLS